MTARQACEVVMRWAKKIQVLVMNRLGSAASCNSCESEQSGRLSKANK